MRLRASLPALLAALLALLVPSRAAASLPRPGELPRALINEAESLPQLPDALEEIDRREERRARCGVFCGEPLELRLNPTIFQARKQVWGLFGAPPPTGPSNNAKARYFDPNFGRFLTQDSYLGQLDNPPSLHRYFYGHANPTRYVDPSGHDAFQIEMQMAGYGKSAPTWGERFLAAWPGAIAGTVVEGLEGTARLAVRVFASMQRPGSHTDVINQQIPDLKRLGKDDVEALKKEGRFYRDTLANLPETGPAALEAAAELGPEGSASAVASATVTTLGTIEGGVALTRGASRVAGRAFARAATAAEAAPVESVFVPRKTYAIGERLPDGRLAGVGPGAALRDGPEFSGAGSTTDSTFSVGRTRLSKAEVDELLAQPGMKTTGTTGAGAARPDRHHIFVQEERQWFKDRGVDIDKYTLELTWGEHSAIHTGGWNARVQQFIADEALWGRHYTRREILKFGAELRREFGLRSVKVGPFGN